MFSVGFTGSPPDCNKLVYEKSSFTFSVNHSLGSLHMTKLKNIKMYGKLVNLCFTLDPSALKF